MNGQARMETTDIGWVRSGETLRQAGHRMSRLGLAALPVRGDDDRVHGVLSREMIVACIADGGDPNVMRAADLAPQMVE